MTGRVLFSCFPGYGHLNPLLPLAGAYREAGEEVTVATGPEMCAEAERHGFAACPVGLSGRDIEQRFLVAHPEYEELGPFERFAVLLSGMFIEVAANERLADLLALCRSWSPGLLIHDTLELAGPVVAAALGLPAVTHGANLARPTAEGLAIATVALTPLWEEAGAPGTAEALIDNPYLDICPPGLAGSEPVAFPTVIPIRAVTGGASDDAELEQDLASLPYERTVHVTLGTVLNRAPGLLESLVEGARSLDVNVVVATAPEPGCGKPRSTASGSARSLVPLLRHPPPAL